MSAFIEESDVVTVTVHYKIDESGKIDILDQVNDGSESLQVVFRRPNFAIAQQLSSASTQVDSSGNPTINFLQLQNSLLYALAKSWDAKDKNNKPVELNNANISRLRVDIARALTTKLVDVVGSVL
jgi:hypothetical protein